MPSGFKRLYSTIVFNTGDPFYCGGTAVSHSGWTVIGMGSTGTAGSGNHYILSCKQALYLYDSDTDNNPNKTCEISICINQSQSGD